MTTTKAKTKPKAKAKTKGKVLQFALKNSKGNDNQDTIKVQPVGELTLGHITYFFAFGSDGFWKLGKKNNKCSCGDVHEMDIGGAGIHVTSDWSPMVFIQAVSSIIGEDFHGELAAEMKG